MTRFQKIQKLSSVIPGISTTFVTFVTMIELKRRKAPIKLWFYFILTFFLSGIIAWLVNTFVMTGQHPILNFVAIGSILAISNIIMVDLQVAAAKSENESQPKKGKKPIHKAIVISCCIAGTVIISAVILLVYIILFPSVDIEDTNGSENTNLTVITIDEILSSTNDYSSFSSFDSHQGKHTGITGKLKDCDYDQVTFRCKKISGVKTLQATKTASDQLVLEIDSELVAGNMEIVIEVDGKHYKSVKVNDVCSITLSGVANKVVAVKIGAERAEMHVSVTRTIVAHGTAT